MLRYLVRRLMLAVPTLVGITIVTFFVIHLAPGDPTGPGPGSGVRPGLDSKKDREVRRRTFFLDLPLFVNVDPKDRRHYTAEMIEAVLRPEPGGVDPGPLLRRGTATVPSLWAYRRHPAVAEVLAELCARHARICPDGDLGAFQKACRWPEPHRDWGTAALPRLMERVESGDESQRISAIAEIGAIQNSSSIYAPGAGPDERQAVLDHWREWWFTHERLYREFSPWERWLGVIGETQYAKWARRVLTGNLGDSTYDRRPVSTKIAEAFRVTALLALLAAFFAYVVAVPLGVWSAVRHESRVDRVIGVVLFVLYSLPSFWVASMLVLLLGGVGYLDVLPIHGICPRGVEGLSMAGRIAACAPHWVLPVFCLGYTSLAVISRYQRSGMLDVVRQDYIRTARAKGLPERAVIFKHALRNSLLPVITYLGLQIPFLLGGSVIVEKIFSIPGIGLLAFEAIFTRDYPTIMGTTVVAALVTMVAVLVADVLYAVVDPRIVYEGR